MNVFADLGKRYGDSSKPFHISGSQNLSVDNLGNERADWLHEINPGDVVAVIGDFDRNSLSALLNLLEKSAIVVPLSRETQADHEYFLSVSGASAVVEEGVHRSISGEAPKHSLVQVLADAGKLGLILFSSGTTGRPKAILHDFDQFLSAYRNPRRPLRTLSFLNFDHIGGINTLFRALYSGGTIITPSGRSTQAVAQDIKQHQIELLPTTPTFLRTMLMHEDLNPDDFRSLKYIVYAAEIMDQLTLDRVCEFLPWVEFRQGYGMSELGIMRIESEARNSLWMRIKDKGVLHKVNEAGLLHLKSERAMLGYLNAEDPFVDGWYNTGDLVETRGDYFRITGRIDNVINVGGLKILPEEIERVARLHDLVAMASAKGVKNPILGQSIEITCELTKGAELDRKGLRQHFAKHLPPHFCPHQISIGEIQITHRGKQA